MSKRPFTLLTLLGIRPDIIRMHKLLRLLDEGQARHGYRHVYVHSGQHYDYELDRVFYRQLQVRAPDLNLGVGRALRRTGKTGHVHQSALLFQKTAWMLERVRPDAVLYLGDTNTVLSSIIVAKYNIPVIHIEGGGRSFDWRMPEEKNRITIDHLSDAIYCYLDRYKEILLAEGIPDYRVVTVGNIIVDALASFLPSAARNPILKRLGVKEHGYALCTLHREENIGSADILADKLNGLRSLSRVLPVVFPLMPRVAARILECKLAGMLKGASVIATRPQGFLEFLRLEQCARVVVTDSGTVQEEALLLGVPCLVTRRSTERPETIAAGATILADRNLCVNARRALTMDRNWDRTVLNPAGGSPSERIFRDIVSKIRSRYFPHSRTLRWTERNRFARESYALDQGPSGDARWPCSPLRTPLPAGHAHPAPN
ncbi:MAG TPA: UDP-N-acetylglucosamine 2-epimerase (non-hydrolyzing) [Candidatus Acidoferrales bacterium]|nr:UDP-N-acetylglucosamine 2-epimerase (non-hydrolyzing) [Candidatus Acidoferrales bacterium]